MVPAPLRRRLTGAATGFALVPAEDGTAELLQRSGGREERLAGLDLAPERLPEARAVIAAMLARKRGKSARMAVRLSDGSALRTVMVLPLAAQANLAQVVSFELDRRTPFKHDEVYYTSRVLQRDTTAQRLKVELTVVPRPVVDDALALAERLGIEPDAVEVAGRDASSPPSGNLLPVRSQPLAARLPGLATAGVVALALALAVAALLIPLYQADRTADLLAEETTAAKRQAEESLKLQKEIEAEVQESGFLGARKRQAPPVSEILFTLTHLLPDDTWLTELQVTNNDVLITGFAASASTVLGLLDQTPRFGNAVFRSPVTQDQRVNREQFNIGAHVIPEAGP